LSVSLCVFVPLHPWFVPASAAKTTRLGFIILGSKVWNTIPICLGALLKFLMNLLVWFFDRFYVVIHLQKQQNLSPFSIKKYFSTYHAKQWFLNQWNFLFLFPIQLLQHGLIIIIVAGFPTKNTPTAPYYLVNNNCLNW
jgi:hypothetical protein